MVRLAAIPVLGAENTNINGSTAATSSCNKLDLDDPEHDDANLDPWTNTSIVPRAEAHEAVRALKRRPGREVLMFGSHVLWNDLLRAGLVDEVHLMIGSAFLGKGVRLFDGPRTGLRLLDAKVLEGSQLILARYAATGAER